MSLLLGLPIFRGYVKFPGCIFVKVAMTENNDQNSFWPNRHVYVFFLRRADSLQSLAPVSWRWQTGKLVWWGFHWIDESPPWTWLIPYTLAKANIFAPKMGWAPKGNDCIPTIHFQLRAVSFREGNFGCFTKECQFFACSFRRSCQILNNHGMKFLSRVPLNKLILACGRAPRPSRKRRPVCRNGTFFFSWGKQWRFFFNSMQDLAIPCTNLEHTNFRFCYEKTGVWLWWSMLVVIIIFVP